MLVKGILTCFRGEVLTAVRARLQRALGCPPALPPLTAASIRAALDPEGCGDGVVPVLQECGQAGTTARPLGNLSNSGSVVFGLVISRSILIAFRLSDVT